MLQRKSEGDALHFDGMACGHSTCGQRIRQVEKKERKGKVAGWSTEKTEESRRGGVRFLETFLKNKKKFAGGTPGVVFFHFFIF